jgi:YidC/Oxa1 family membrane protein insertase
MDNKRLIIGMLLAMAIMLGWSAFVSHMAKRNNWEPASKAQPQQQVAQSTQAAPPSTVPGAAQGTQAAPAATAGGLRIMEQGAQIQDALLGSNAEKDPVYSMGLETSSEGASIARVTLNEFPNSKRDARYSFQQTPEGGNPSMATLWVQINGQRLSLAHAQWQRTKVEKEQVHYTVEIGKDKPMLRVNKIFQISPKTSDGGKDGPQGYEVRVRHTLENLSGEPMQVELGLAGPTTPPKEIERGPDRYVLAGYNDDPSYRTGRIVPTSWAVESLTGDKQTVKVEKSEKGWPLIWAGLSSTYFDALVLPVAAGKDNRTTAEFIGHIEARSLAPQGSNPPTEAELLLTTKPLSVNAGQTSSFDLVTFFGPKARAVLKNDYYSVFPRMYAVTLSTTGSCTYCTFQWLVDAMVWLLDKLEWVFHDWGLAIIGLVVIVRLLLHPLTRKSTISMAKMQKLAPEMERLKLKYKDDPTELNRAMMQFYKENGASQVLGCLPMFIQMPIWIALWSSLQSTFELRLEPFLWGFTWIKDLAKPDALYAFSTPIPLIFGWHLSSINLLPILLGVVFFVQQKFQPKPPSMSPEQEQQQKMMMWMMPMLFPLMLYTGPSGLNLYILTSTTIGIIESKIIRDHIKAREAAQAASGPTIIDAPATRVSRRRREEEREQPSAPKGMMGRLMDRLNEYAEEAKRRSEQPPTKKRRDGK